MKPSSPKTIVWIIGLIAGILGIVGHYYNGSIPFASEHNYLLLLAGFVLLAVGTSFKGV